MMAARRMLDTDEETLLYAWRGGDRTAGDRLMRLHYAPIRRFFQLRAADVADDLTQRTFLASTEARDRIAVTREYRAAAMCARRVRSPVHPSPRPGYQRTSGGWTRERQRDETEQARDQ